MSALPQRSSSLQCSRSNAFLQPLLHQGGCSRGGHLGLNCQGCCGTCSTPFSGLLQPSVRCVEDLGVVASSHRPLPSQSFCGRVSLSDGDHSVCAPVRASGRLDGLHRSQGSVSSSASSSCLSSLSTLRLPWTGLPVQGSVLWPLHGSAGLHQGHGSCFSYTPFSRYPYASIPRRLVSPVLLSGVSPERSSDCPRSVSRVGDCHQPVEVQPRTFPGCTISRGRYRLHLFQGFSISGTRHTAAVNSRRISILRLASRELMALAAGRPFFAGSPRSWRPAKDAFPPALPPSFLEPSGSGGSYLRERVMRPPAWDLSKVLTYLVSPAFEPLSQASFRALTMKTLFLLALATAKRVGELQALSSVVTFVAGDACLSYIPQFVAKSESLTRSIPRSFLVKSLADFAAGLDDDLLLCPVRALRLYLPRARSLSPGRHRLFVSPRRPTRHLSKNALSFFLREVISAAGATRPQVGPLRAHEVRSVSTSVAFHRNWSVSSVLESATWASSSVFSSFYLRDIQHEYDGLLSLGPFVAAGSRIG